MKKILYILLAVLIVSGLMGCQPTPEEAVVKSKVDDNYIDRINESIQSQQQEPAEEQTQEEASFIVVTETTHVSEYIQAKEEGQHIQIDADIITPQVTAYPSMKIYPSKMTQEQVDLFLDTYFPEREALANNDIAQIPTKSELEEEILTLQSWIASEELSTNADGTTNYDEWQDQIDFLTEQLKDAPEEHSEMPYDITKFSAIPLMEVFREEGMTIEDLNWQMEDMVELARKDGRELIDYFIKIEDDKQYHVYVLRSDEPNVNYFSFGGDNNCIDICENYLDISSLKITYSQAQAIADQAKDILGLNYMEVCYSAKSSYRGSTNVNNIGPLYHFVYTRSISGASETFTSNKIDAMRLNYRPWNYEYFEVWLDDSGIQKAQFWSCPSISGDIVSNNVPLIAFEEIMDKARQSFSLGIMYHSNNANGYESLLANNLLAELNDNSIIIDKVVLGYMRVRQGSGDNEYLLIPVWDFIGRESIHMDIKSKNGSITVSESEMPEYGYGDQHSFLTINAIDGSLIDRSVGY